MNQNEREPLLEDYSKQDSPKNPENLEQNYLDTLARDIVNMAKHAPEMALKLIKDALAKIK
ncbi:MAG: hypothetical protein KW793_00100 [Candidatus Doudnabacteria bacterium]|nr:hypothetical protein [Candidatus Doudnabacteria bacterium]